MVLVHPFLQHKINFLRLAIFFKEICLVSLRKSAERRLCQLFVGGEIDDEDGQDGARVDSVVDGFRSKEDDHEHDCYG